MNCSRVVPANSGIHNPGLTVLLRPAPLPRAACTRSHSGPWRCPCLATFFAENRPASRRPRPAALSHAAMHGNGEAGKTGNAQSSEPRAPRHLVGAVFPHAVPGYPGGAGPRGVLVRAASMTPQKWHRERGVPAGARRGRGERMKRPASGIAALSFADWRRSPGWSRERDAEHVAWFVSTVAPAYARSVLPTYAARSAAATPTRSDFAAAPVFLTRG